LHNSLAVVVVAVDKYVVSVDVVALSGIIVLPAG